jgi:hypothetical protein
MPGWSQSRRLIQARTVCDLIRTVIGVLASHRYAGRIWRASSRSGSAAVTTPMGKDDLVAKSQELGPAVTTAVDRKDAGWT